MDTGKIEGRKGQARGWFESLRDQIIAAFEGLEDALPATAPLAGLPAGRFARARPGAAPITAVQPAAAASWR